MKLTSKNKSYLMEALVLLCISLIPLLWFPKNHMLIGGDSGYPIDFDGYFKERSFTWLSSQNFGYDMAPQMGQISLHAIQYVIYNFGFSYYDVQKVTFVLWFFAMSASMYLFIRYLYPENKYWSLRLVGVVFYTINFYLFSFWMHGAQPTFSLFVILPLTVLFLLKLLRNELSPFKTAVLLNISFFFFNSGGIFGFPLLGSVFLASFTLIFYYLILSRKRYDALWKIGKFFFFSFVLGLIVNAYWIYPFLASFSQQYSTTFSKAGGAEGATGWVRFISEYTSFINLTRLQGDLNWYSPKNTYSGAFQQNVFLVAVSFIYPVLAFSAIFFVKNIWEKKIVVYLMLLCLVGIFFSAGAHEPLGRLYVFLIENIPGFAAFRSAYYKFIPTLYFAYSTLIAICIYNLSVRLNLRYFLALSFIVLILIYHYPFYSSSNFVIDKPFTTMVEVPSYVFEFGNYANQLPDDKRILIIPPYTESFAVEALDWNFIGFQQIFQGLTSKRILYNAVALLQNEKGIVDSIYRTLQRRDDEGFLNIADQYNIGYVLVTRDAVYNFKGGAREDPKIYYDYLKKNKNFSLVWERGKWSMFAIKNSSNNGIIRAVDDLTAYSNDNKNNNINGLLKKFPAPFFSPDKITQDQKNLTLVSSLPYTREVTSYPCTSCQLQNDMPNISILESPILPGSLLYGLQKKEEIKRLNSASDLQQRLAILLELTKLKSGELKALQKLGIDYLRLDEWLQMSKSFKSYFVEINKITRDPKFYKRHYDSLKTVDGYTKAEEDTIKGVLGSVDFTSAEPLEASLNESLKVIVDIRSFLSGTFNTTNESEYVFLNTENESGERKLFINKNSFPAGLKKESLMPVSYTLQKGKLQNIADFRDFQDVVLGGNELIKLQLQETPNLVYKMNVTLVKAKGGQFSCVSSEIPNYSWEKNYTVFSTVQGLPSKAEIYVKREYSPFGQSLQQKLFVPDKVEVLDRNKDQDFITLKFRGEPYDFGAKVYFCTDLKHDPRQVFIDMAVFESANPQLFSLNNNNEQIKLKKPELSYRQVNPTEYEVSVFSAEEPFILSFSERYSPLWELRLNNTALKDKHFMINGALNGWYIDKKGSYTIRLSYLPQSQFEHAIIISLISISLLFVYVALGSYKNKNVKRKKINN